MANLINRKSLFLCAQPTWDLDPTIADSGASCVPVETQTLGLPDDTTEELPWDIQSGINEPTDSLVGAKGVNLNFSMALKGLKTAAGSAVNASTVTKDALTLLLENMLQTRVTTAGALVTSSAAGTLTTSGTFNRRDLVYVYDPGLFTPNKGQWARIAGAASPYAVNPSWLANPTATGVIYGVEQYTKPGDIATPSWLTAIVNLGPQIWSLTSGRVTKFTIDCTAKKVVTVNVTLAFNDVNRVTGARGSLPAFIRSTQSEIQGRACRWLFGDTQYDFSQITFDMQIKSQEVLSALGAQGRQDIAITQYEPIITAMPLYATAWEDAFWAGQTNYTMLQFGAGVLAGGAVNTVGIFGERAQVTQAKLQDDNGIYRNGVKLKLVNAFYPTALGGTTHGHMVTIARA